MFDATIEQMVALAVLMPIVASMGGNAGTQTLTITVRALATKELTSYNTMRAIRKELLVGVLNGFLFALIAGAATVFIFGDLGETSILLGGIIAGAMVINMIVAGLSGVVLPVLLDRWGVDPAVASGVFVTTVTDVVGFFAFLALASLAIL
jgi:magnesium transporter